SCSATHRDLPSFPTRRSSDLVGRERTTPLTAPRRQARPGGCALMGREGYHSALPLARTQAGGRGANLKGTTMRVVYSGVLAAVRSEEHTSELQSRSDLVCRLL